MPVTQFLRQIQATPLSTDVWIYRAVVVILGLAVVDTVFGGRKMTFATSTRARAEQADKLFREIIEIADDKSGDCITTSDGKRIVDHENIQRSRLRVDARRFSDSEQWSSPVKPPRSQNYVKPHDARTRAYMSGPDR
jgi:hypothetical protein